MAQYVDPVTNTTYTSPEVARQYGVSVPDNITSGVGINTQTQQANQAISMDQLNPASPITVPTPTPTANPIDGVAEGAKATSKSLADYIKELTPPETETSKKYDTLANDISSLLPGLSGRGQAQLDAEQAAGLPQQRQQLAKIQADLLMKVAEATKSNTSYEQLIANLENPNNAQQQGIPMAAIIGQQAQVRKVQLAEANSKSSDLLLLQAVASGLSGNLQAAQENVNRAIDLRYADIQDTLTLKMNQLSLLEGKLNREESIQKAALQRKYEDEQRAIENQKELDRSIQTIAINAAQNGADSQTMQSIQQASNPIEAASAYGRFVQNQKNLADINATTVTSPFIVNAKGEVQDAKTGYGFSSPGDFYAKTGMTLDMASSQGLLKPLGPTKAEQQQNFENTITLEKLNIDKAQLDISRYNASTSRINANNSGSAGMSEGDLIAYAQQYAATGTIPTGLPKGSFGLVSQVAGALPKAPGTIVSTATGIVPSSSALSSTQGDGVSAMYNLVTNVIPSLKTAFSEVRTNPGTGLLNALRLRTNDVTQYNSERTNFLNALLLAQSGKVVSEQELKRYQGLIPSLSTNRKSNGNVQLDQLEKDLRERLSSYLSTNQLTIVGYDPKTGKSVGNAAKFDQ